MFKTFFQTAVQSTGRYAIGEDMGDGMIEIIVAVYQISASTSSI